jgi:arylsulfatase A
VPERHGFDHFYGHLCQRVAHNHYTDHVWRDGMRVDLEGNVENNLVGHQYAPDLMADEAVEFIKRNRDKTFFLYFATPLPHLALQVPKDAMEPYLGAWGEEKPYDGKKGYLPTPTPHAAYAGMVSRIDEYVGRIMATLKELNLDDNTLVLFTSDNGPTFVVGGADSAFFHSAGPFRGLKQDVYEGGIRVPFIARWLGHIKPGASSDFPCAFWDLMPTCADVARASTPRDLDGLSLAPTLLQRGQQLRHEYLYWEYHSQGDSQTVRMDDWKAVRNHVRNHFADAPIELYNLSSDTGEQHDVAAEHPEIVARVKQIMTVTGRSESENPKWNFKPVAAARSAAR